MTYINQLEHLRTFNIRNLPNLSGPTPLRCKIPQLIDSIAMATVKAMHKHQNAPSNLGVIGFGAITYGDTWIGRSRIASTKLEQFLCPRIYYIEKHANIKGTMTPVLTQIAQGTAVQAKEYSSHLRIFEPYWIN